MFCKNCGKQIEEDSLFCPYCGTAVKSGNTGTDSQNDSLYDQVIEYDAPEETVVLSESNKPRFHKIQGPEGHEGPNYHGHHSSQQSHYNAQENYPSGYTAADSQQNSGYHSSQSGYGAANSAGAQNGYGAANGAGAQNGYGAANGAGAQNGYGAANGAGAQNSYGAANSAGAQNGYGAANGAGVQNGYGAANRSGAQNGYGWQGNYSQQANYGQQNYNTQGAYHQGNYASQGTYTAQGNYTAQGVYNQGAGQTYQKPKKKLGKGAIIGICIGSVAVVAAIIAVCLFFFFRGAGGGSYEQPLKNFAAAVNKGDLKAMMDTVPLEAALEEGTYSDFMMGMDYDDMINVFQSQFQTVFLDGIKDEYGSDFSLECRIYGGETLSPSEIAELNSDYASYFGTPSDFIEDAVLVDCDMIITSGDGTDIEDADINVVKVNGRWYIDILSMS